MLTRSELESKMMEMGSDYFSYLRTNRGKQVVLEAVLEQKLLVRAALERGLDREDAVKEKLRRLRYEQEQALRIYQEEILSDELLRRLRSHELEVREEEVANYYKEHQRLYRVRHILLADKNKAAALHDELKQAKGDISRIFAHMAQQHSLDAASAKDGGKLPLFMEGEMDESFEAAVRRLEAGQFSEVVETKLGYHIIFSEGSSLALYADEIKQRCRRILERRKLEAMLRKWKERYPVEVYDDSLRPFML